MWKNCVMLWVAQHFLLVINEYLRHPRAESGRIDFSHLSSCAQLCNRHPSLGSPSLRENRFEASSAPVPFLLLQSQISGAFCSALSFFSGTDMCEMLQESSTHVSSFLCKEFIYRFVSISRRMPGEVWALETVLGLDVCSGESMATSERARAQLMFIYILLLVSFAFDDTFYIQNNSSRAVYSRLSRRCFSLAFVSCFPILSDGITWRLERNAIASWVALLLTFCIRFCLFRLKREEGGGSIIIQAMAQPQQLQQQSIQQQSMDSRPMDHDEKKMRRQIANSNERRRMQSINAGFQSLRQLLPHHEGEKLSKVSHKLQFYMFCDRSSSSNNSSP